MASMRRAVLQNGQVRYRVRVRTNGGYRHGTFPTKAEASRWAAKTERECTLSRRSPLGQSEIVTVAELFDRYRRQVLRHKRWHTQRQQGQQLDWWERFLGAQTPLVAVSAERVSAAKDALIDYAPGTVNRYLAVLSHVCGQAVREWRCMEINPVSSVKRLREGKGRTRWLRADERKRLLCACATSPNRMLYALVVLALSTGARKDEIRTLRWDQVDLWRSISIDGRQVEIGRAFLEAQQTKTEEARALIFYGEALQLMRKLHRERRPGAAWVFPSPRDAHRPIDFRTAWERALEKADISNFCFHDLRHSAASYLGEQGASLAQIGAILGHKSAATTKKYTHFTSSGTEHLVARMNGAVFGRRA